jgi:hypothetical protein
MPKALPLMRKYKLRRLSELLEQLFSGTAVSEPEETKTK